MISAGRKAYVVELQGGRFFQDSNEHGRIWTCWHVADAEFFRDQEIADDVALGIEQRHDRPAKVREVSV